ncbi:hypothetical protein [Ferruginibacter sp.]
MAWTEENGKVILEKGLHKIKVVYYDAGGENGLTVSYNLSGQKEIPVPASILLHE